jgi:hypothetical protein
LLSSRARRFLRALRWAAPLALILVASCALLRPNRAEVSPDLGLETWPGVADGLHNSNTDLVHWRGAFWLVHAAAPWHFASTSTRLVLWRSEDARRFERVTEFQNPGEDIRDPKLVVMGDRLFLYWLNNRSFPEPEPYLTQVTWSDDGRRWAKARGIGHEGWLFWRPRSPDGGRTWYAMAYWHEHGRAALFRSSDGLEWQQVSVVLNGEAVDEPDFEFLADGRMIVTGRAEGGRSLLAAKGWFGHSRGHTCLVASRPPFTSWSYARSYVTRLDGPRLFSYGGRVYALGRSEPWGFAPPLFHTGSILSRKRTSLFLVEPDRLIKLSDFPSAGDTSYAGVAVAGDYLYASYYTSDVTRDWPWIVGMLRASEIRMARFPLDRLDSLARPALGSATEPSATAVSDSAKND